MNCEQVEERLSPYLDNMLAADERGEIAFHLQSCSRCMMSLAELRQNDILLARLPRIQPHPAMRQRFFSSPQMQEITGGDRFSSADGWTRPLMPRQLSRREPGLHQRTNSLPGGRAPLPPTAEIPATPPTMILHPSSSQTARRVKTFLIPWKVAVAAILILALGTAFLLTLSLHRPASSPSLASDVLTPPAAGPDTGSGQPLAAGTRFVFLRSGALWSTLADGSGRSPERLTPPDVQVDANWTVSPTLAGHTAGDSLAYIDLRGATVHTIRSDGQQDTTIALSLLKAGTNPAAVWETATGEAILHSLSWSANGTMLAFVADPAGNGQTTLYIYSTASGKVQSVVPGRQGSVLRPAWSPDNSRLAFEVTENGTVSILDYNVQNGGVLDLTSLAASQGGSGGSILSMDWLPGSSEPALTWSLGTLGHLSSLWIYRVGANGTTYPQLLLSGDYVQALYSPDGDNGPGSWLVVAALNGLAGDIWRLDLTPGASLVRLSQGRQVSLARWSPDGSSIFYMDQQVNGVGRGYIANVATGANLFVASNVASDPIPVWSKDSRRLAYSTGTRIRIVDTQSGSQIVQLGLQGSPTSLSWSPAASGQLIITLGDTPRGIYLVDTTDNTSRQLDHQGTDSMIQWTEIP